MLELLKTFEQDWEIQPRKEQSKLGLISQLILQKSL